MFTGFYKKNIYQFFMFLLIIAQLSIQPQTVDAAPYNIQNPVTNSYYGTTWNSIYFGNYWQTDITGQTKEPIQWRVLYVNGVDAYLVADKNLDTIQYNKNTSPTTWETSYIRKWLNTTFLNEAFTKQEQQAIINTSLSNEPDNAFAISGGNDTTDKVFLLSLSDMKNTKYGFYSDIQKNNNARISLNTPYLANKTGMHTAKGDCYWLRTPGYLSTHICRINEKGYGDIYGMAANSSRYAIRPAIHLNLGYYRYWTKGNNIISKDDIIPHKVQNTKPKKVVKPKKATISSLTLSKNRYKLKVKWKKVSHAAGYEIQFSNNSKFKKAKTLDTNRTFVYIKRIKANKKYYIRIRAYNYNSDYTIIKYGKWSKTKTYTKKSM